MLLLMIGCCVVCRGVLFWLFLVVLGLFWAGVVVVLDWRSVSSVIGLLWLFAGCA